jgi:molecular chaperone GrpE
LKLCVEKEQNNGEGAKDVMMSGDEKKIQPGTTGETSREAPEVAPVEEPEVKELQDTLAAVQQELAKKTTEAAEYLDNWRRGAAELSNARKRMLREQEEARANAAQRVLEKLLPVVDDMDRAFAALPEDQAEGGWASGFRAIERKLQGLLESEGVIQIRTEGQMFDPALHHAITHEEADGYDEGQIIEEVGRGYMLHDKVLRPSMVRVAKANSA